MFSRNLPASFSTSVFRGKRRLKGESPPGASPPGKIQKQPFPAIFWCFHAENREKKEKRKRKKEGGGERKNKKKRGKREKKGRKEGRKSRTLIGKASVMYSLTLILAIYWTPGPVD